jgi:hypothetical protein
MALRTPIVTPRSYFESRGFDLLPAAVAVGVAVAFGGWLLTLF